MAKKRFLLLIVGFFVFGFATANAQTPDVPAPTPTPVATPVIAPGAYSDPDQDHSAG
jgi:hypothetical protein